MSATARPERRPRRWRKRDRAAARATDTAATPAMRQRGTLGRLLRLCRPYLRWLLGGAACLLVAGTLGLAIPWLVRGVIDGALGLGGGGGLGPVVGALILIALAQAAFSFGQAYLLSAAGERLVADLRRRLYRHLQALSVGFFDGRRIGELLSRLTNDVGALQQAVGSGLLNALQQILIVVGAAALLVLTDWRLALVALAVLPPIVVASAFFGRRLERLSTETQAELGAATAVLEETIAGARTVRAFAREEYEIARYEQSVARTFDASMRRSRLRAAFIPIITLCALLGVIGVMIVGATQVGRGALTPGALVSVILYMTMMAGALGGLTGVYAQLREAGGAASRLFELLDTAPEITDAPDARPLPDPLRGEVRLDGLSFAYGHAPDAPTALRDIDLVVAPGERVALVGPSGAGKSTLINLLLRFYDPTRGRITIDGHDTRTVTLASLRDALGVVPQDPILFGGTVAENIAYGRPDATPAEIAAAAANANAHDLIAELPEGYATVVGERGVRLSGGQRQRIAIARALLKDPRVLLLDEATSSLDGAAEAAVRDALDRLMRGRTTIVVAHRLSTIEDADRIVVLDAGRIAEEGRHADLLARGGLYHRLYTRSPPPDPAPSTPT